MPQFARTKILLQEDCYREKPETIKLNYTGPNVGELYHKIYELIKAVFRAADSDIQEERSSWGKGEKEKFKARWYLHKDLDAYSYMYLRFDVSGQGDEKTGNATVSIKPVLRTEYPQDTIWQRSIFYEMVRVFWHRSFYYRKREEYAEDCRNLVTIFNRNVHEFFRQLREQSG